MRNVSYKDGTGCRLEPDSDKPGEFKRVHTGKCAVVEVGFQELEENQGRITQSFQLIISP